TTRLLHAAHHKYAPVIIDVFFDYLLVENWEVYSQTPLEDFANRVYTTLRENIDHIPSDFHARTLSMVEHQWLLSYTTLEGMEDTFRRMKRRVSKPEHLENAVRSLQDNHKELTDTFHLFFPELIQLVRETCFC
ncbi:MAG: acyl carrier protein phosphodiesterase, partial [Bacteroidota bacterium]